MLADNRAYAAAPQIARYNLANGYFRISGSYGKLTNLQVDPTGKGHYEKPTCSSVFIGSVDMFDARLNSGVKVALTDQQIALSNIVLATPNPLLQNQSNGMTPALQPGHSFGQAFTVTAQKFLQVGLQLQTSTAAGLTVTLYGGKPETGLRRIAGKRFTAITTSGWIYLDVPAQPAGDYYLEIAGGTGGPSWAVQRAVPMATAPGGSAYTDRTATAEWLCTLSVDGYDVSTTARWTITVDRNRLTSKFNVTPTDSAPQTPLSFITPWQRDGYELNYADNVLFSRFFTDNGRYMPAEQLKRQTSFALKFPSPQWFYATGTGPYDLRWSTPGILVNGPSTPDTMTFAMTRTAADGTPAPPAALTLEVLPHSEELPEFYPRFTASDQTRADNLTTFFYERAYSHSFSNATDWKDWENRVLDWSNTGGIPALRKSLLIDTKMSDDGYCYAWSTPGWPWPNPQLYDTRHFVTNAMFVLAIGRHYSWTGDREFLAAALPRMRLALNFLLTQCGGQNGLLTLDFPDHTGVDQALGDNYYDITSFGYQNAFDNAYYYGALLYAAEIEKEAGNPQRGRELNSIAALVKKQYNETFWDDDAGRYIECLDAEGNKHDYGSSFVNVEAASFGLPSAAQAKRIFGWLDNGKTELTDWLVLIQETGTKSTLSPGHTLGQSFVTSKPFTQVGSRYMSAGNLKGEFTLSLYAGGPGGTKIASKRFTRCWDYAWAHLDVDPQPAGTYYLEFSDPTDTITWSDGATAYPDGVVYADGKPVQTPTSRTLIVVSPYYDGDADIYSRWVFAPRTTSRRNNFWYSFTWHPWVPWEEQLQDGGTSLYISGFDVMSRAKYLGGDNAWKRLSTIVDRWSEPDHICGGDPLYRGEHPQGAAAGAVGVDTAFPESGLAPAGFLYGILGVEAAVDALEITPHLPAALDHAGVDQLYWRGRYVQLQITKDTISLHGPGVDVEQKYQPGQTIRVPAPRTWE